MQTEEEEHCSMLSVAKMYKSSALCCRYHLTQKSNKREENLEETFPFPATQPHRTTADEVNRVRHGGPELHASLRATREVSTKHLDCPPDGEHNEERSRQSVPAKSSHFHLCDVALLLVANSNS